MFTLAVKQLKFDYLKTCLTCFALASVIAVILILKGFEQGQYHQLKEIVLNRNADLIATQKGVQNFIATRSVIPQLAREEIEAVPGVAATHPITALPVIYEKGSKRTPIYVIVFDTKGGPSSFIEGRSEQFGPNIVIDQALAKKYQLSVGDPLMISDFEFTITGITQEAAFMMPFAFINYDGMLDLFLESDIAPDLSTFPLLSYLLIEVDQGHSTNQVMQKINGRVEHVDVYPIELIAKNDMNLGKTFFSPIMGVLISVGFIIGLLVISLTMYSEINSNYRNYAILKALGFTFGNLILLVSVYALILILLAIPIALILSMVVAMIIEILSPVYLIRIISIEVIILALSSCTIFALVGSLMPLVSIKRCDPMMAFQAS